ncbi:hypothetical protein [Nesterenkonia sp.]|uniref:hypothetical protein n=1 Tax=Nesterenkonia sp. TaxID=704201 RepID=UPI00261663AE|nr:hypothetical protein [Nesterenkonia sp.]
MTPIRRTSGGARVHLLRSAAALAAAAGIALSTAGVVASAQHTSPAAEREASGTLHDDQTAVDQDCAAAAPPDPEQDTGGDAEMPAERHGPEGPTAENLTDETRYSISFGEGGTGQLPVNTGFLVYTELGSYVSDGTQMRIWLVPADGPGSAIDLGPSTAVEHWYADIHNPHQDYTSRIVLPAQIPSTVPDGQYHLVASSYDHYVFGWHEVTVDSTLDVPDQEPQPDYPGEPLSG